MTYEDIEILPLLLKKKDIKTDFSNYEIINEKYLLPYPEFNYLDKSNTLSLINSFFIKNTKENILINFNIIFNKKNENINFVFTINDVFILGESKGVDIRIRNSLEIQNIKNKNIIFDIMKNTTANLGKQISILLGIPYITVKGKIKQKLLDEISFFIFNNIFKNVDFFKNYINTLNYIYEEIYFTEKSKNDITNIIKKFNINKINSVENKNKTIKHKDDIISFLERNAFKNRQMLIFGKHGTGKTYNIRKFIEANNYTLINIQGNESIDDIYLKGHLIKDYEGNFKWKYGKLSLAYKRALKGEKVIVFIDEFLRLPEKTFNNLITAMDPYEGYYIFDTERPIKNNTLEDEDCLETEELKVSINNLWFICATNIGREYNVEELEPALKDRFIIYNMEMKKNDKYNLIKKIIKEANYEEETEHLLLFFKKIERLYELEEIDNNINIRHISDIVLMSENIKEIPYRVKDKILVWVSNDLNGNPIKEQKEIIEKIINEIWKF